LLEYQGKELFREYGIPIPFSYLAYSKDDALKASKKFEYPVVLKSQLTVGGRGKAGAIVKCMNSSELASTFEELIEKEVKGELPRGILIEEAVDKNSEIYLSFFLNRSKRCYSLIASAEGGVDIESVTNKVVLDLPLDGLLLEQAKEVATKLGLQNASSKAFVEFTMKMASLVKEKEVELAEVNPLAILKDGSLMALDSKIIIDDNAMFRHPELKKYEYVSEIEEQAGKSGFSLVELNGNIAIIGNGAGLVMSTVDMVMDRGGKAGCFLDFGGGATTQTIYDALKVISNLQQIRVILVNLFGGIVRTNLVAQAILDAYRNNLVSVPVFARITGAESEKAKAMLVGSKAKLYDTVEEAIDQVVRQVS
jgi:succinyl-CoA synthetase beta subunit